VCSYFFGTGFYRVTIFGDDVVGGFVEHRVDFVIAWFGAVPGVGNVFVAAGVDFVHEQVDFGVVVLAAGDAAHIVNDVACHGVNLIKALEISGSKATGALAADVDAVEVRNFLGEGVGGFAGVIAVGAGAIDLPVEACGKGFFAEDAFGEGAAADIAEADH
jgi:hypothetical protein